MRWRAVVLSAIFLVLGFECWAQREAGSFQGLSDATLSKHADFGRAPGRELASLSLGLFENKDPSTDQTATTPEGEKAPKSLGEQVWSLLNSNFGLWVLSSIVLAWITKAYSVRQAHKAEILKRTETAKRLDTEIAYRLAMSLAGLRINEVRIGSETSTARGIYVTAYNYLENFFLSVEGPYKGRDFSVFPEYRERTFRALILELRTVVDADDGPDLKTALDAYEELAELGDIAPEDSAPQACRDAVAKARDLLERGALRTRWRSMVNFLDVRKTAGGA
ncbi:MAG: hypothetical protein ABSC02_08845 [Acidobacteriota bacterium]|jgi:hypothetical protein